MRQVQCILLCLGVTLASASSVSAQVKCGAKEEYPYMFCPGKVVKCSKDPHNEPGLTPFMPGLPNLECYGVFSNSAVGRIEAPVGVGRSMVTVYQSGLSGPDALEAYDAWDDLCPNDVHDDCCFEFIETTDPRFFRENGFNPATQQAFSVLRFDPNSCDWDCSDVIIDNYSYLNFSDEFLFEGNDPALSDVSQFIVQSQFLPNLVETGQVKYWDARIMMAHVLAHFAGYPDEFEMQNAGLQCGTGSSIMAVNPNGKFPVPLEQHDMCWFMRLYCPSEVTNSVAAKSTQNLPITVVNLSPTTFLAKVKATSLNKISTSLYDLLGHSQSVSMTKSHNGAVAEIIIDAQVLSNGTYVLRIETSDGVGSVILQVMR